MVITQYHAKYYAFELSKRSSSDSLEKLTTTLSNAQVDLNPHHCNKLHSKAVRTVIETDIFIETLPSNPVTKLVLDYPTLWYFVTILFLILLEINRVHKTAKVGGGYGGGKYMNRNQ